MKFKKFDDIDQTWILPTRNIILSNVFLILEEFRYFSASGYKKDDAFSFLIRANYEEDGTLRVTQSITFSS